MHLVLGHNLLLLPEKWTGGACPSTWSPVLLAPTFLLFLKNSLGDSRVIKTNEMGWRLLCCLVVVVVVVGDWVEWPNDAEVPPGVRVRTDVETGQRWVNSTKEDVEALWRASVDAATKRDDQAFGGLTLKLVCTSRYLHI